MDENQCEVFYDEFVSALVKWMARVLFEDKEQEERTVRLIEGCMSNKLDN